MAKSPTPIPAPPVKIQRGAPTNTPVKKRRRKKRVNPFVLLLRGLARRIYFGVKTAFKFLLLVPILVYHMAQLILSAWIAPALARRQGV